MIYIAAHKSFVVPALEGYRALQVGAKGKADLGFLRDDTGASISEKNPNFCELTGVYWVWKNTQDEHKGLVHYRRYFGRGNLSSKESDIYSYQEMLGFLDEADIVLPYTEYLKQSAKDEILIRCCTPEIFEKLEHCVQERYPEYMPEFRAYFAQNRTSLFNMMFCKAELFDAYCEWLFDILFALERQTDLTGLDDYRKRLYGFLSERLLNVWVMHRHLRVKHVPVVNVEMPMKEKLTLLRRRVTNRMYFSLHGKK